MSSISWVEENRGNHGLLIQFEDPEQPQLEVFFPTRLRMYLDLLNYLPLPAGWLTSLPELDIEVTVPNPGPDCIICTNPYIRNSQEPLFGKEQVEIPVRLPCGHIMGLNCLYRLAWSANASTGVICPFCRASHNHMPVTAEETEDKLAKCMWIMLEIFLRLQGGRGYFEDMDTVLEWVEDDEYLREDVPEEEKREAIKYGAKCWAEIGDEELLRLLAARVHGYTVRCTTP